jgi:hypothetical protein
MAERGEARLPNCEILFLQNFSQLLIQTKHAEKHTSKT